MLLFRELEKTSALDLRTQTHATLTLRGNMTQGKKHVVVVVVVGEGPTERIVWIGFLQQLPNGRQHCTREEKITTLGRHQ